MEVLWIHFPIPFNIDSYAKININARYKCLRIESIVDRNGKVSHFISLHLNLLVPHHTINDTESDTEIDVDKKYRDVNNNNQI